MDGFEQNQNILIIGATNHEDSLDSAATRPGRFDKKIQWRRKNRHNQILS